MAGLGTSYILRSMVRVQIGFLAEEWILVTQQLTECGESVLEVGSTLLDT